MAGIQFGFTTEHALGFVIFMILAWGVYWITLPQSMQIKSLEDKPFASELVHYIFFMIGLLIIIPFVMRYISAGFESTGVINKAQANSMSKVISNRIPVNVVRTTPFRL